MAVSAAFHRNLSLLTQLVPPSDDFKRHFREGMFDKPNSAGFIVVSHYLLTTYDAERFRELIEWPVNCKKTEAKYRKDVRDYLTKIASENSDITFPTILASHLFHASGIKFVSIMWKLSQVVLRTCIKRHTSRDVMPMPKTGTAIALTMKSLSGTISSNNNVISTRLKTLFNLEEISKVAIQTERESLAAVKVEIFEKEKRIAECADVAPVHPLIKKRLKDINDPEVVEMWKAHINQGAEHIAESDRVLKKVEELTTKVHDVIMTNADKKMLDGKEFEKIDLSSTPEVLRENAGFANVLYKENQLVLKTFLQMFSALLEPIELCLKRRNLTDFTDCMRQIKESQEYLEAVRSACLSILENIRELSSEAKHEFNERQNSRILDETVSSPVINNEILMPSPHFNIDTNTYNSENHDLQSRLALTPVEGAHKCLFSRYVPQTQTYQESGARLRPNLLLSRINLNDTMLSSMDSQHSRSRKLTPKKFSSVKLMGSGRYSRLFSNQTNRSNRTIGNDSIISLPCSSKANSTTIANAIGEMRDISELSLDIAVKGLCDISADIQTPEKPSRKEQEKSRDQRVKTKANVPEIREITELEVTTTSGILTKEASRQRRRSIGDLVERYKKVVEASKRTQSPHISAIPQEDE